MTDNFAISILNTLGKESEIVIYILIIYKIIGWNLKSYFYNELKNIIYKKIIMK